VLREDLATQSEEKIKEIKIFVGCIHFGWCLILLNRTRASKLQNAAADSAPYSKPHWAISGGLWRSSLDPALAAILTHSLSAYRAIPIRGTQSACVSGI
jgi:hypothetical protein